MNSLNIVRKKRTRKEIRFISPWMSNKKYTLTLWNAHTIIELITFLCSFVCLGHLSNQHSQHLLDNKFKEVNFSGRVSMHIVWDWYNKSFLINQYAEFGAHCRTPCAYSSIHPFTHSHTHMQTTTTMMVARIRVSTAQPCLWVEQSKCIYDE